MPESLVVPSRFNGPLESGNGGYAAGAIASYLGGVAAVSLRRPVPLDEPLRVADAETPLSMYAGDSLVAEAEPAAPQIDVPAPVSVGAAREASKRYRGIRGGIFSRCFVCGLDRDDSFGVLAGEVDGRDLVACPWTPPAWAADADGAVRPELIWAVLDCPTYFAAYLRQELALSFLARMTARVDSRVAAGREHVVMAWPVETDGRKRRAGSAVVSADGEALAVAEVLLIEPR